MQQPVASSSSSSSTVPPCADRLYVGNLSPTVDEFTLIQIFSKYGKITKMDFMFHKTGVLKGKPRGFAFIQFSEKADALKSMVKLHDRLLRGRKLVVTFASSAPPDNTSFPTNGRRSDPAKTTTLSLLKTQKRPQSAAAQIAAMEAKLASMQKRKPADEDWVPGQDPGVGSSSASPAPIPLAEADTEDLLGEDEVREAADDLEREIMGDVAVKSISGDSSALLGAETQTSAAGQSPTGTPSVEVSVKRGLASLPRKPGF